MLGWVLELLFRRFLSGNNPERKWINPGFMVGPYVPLYGSGLCILYLVSRLAERNTLAMALRLLLAFICGGVIGAEREIKRRPAGFRTHILICLGAAITTLTSQYLLLGLGLFTDIGRLGAQVIAGIGFIGGGHGFGCAYRR